MGHEVGPNGFVENRGGGFYSELFVPSCMWKSWGLQLFREMNPALMSLGCNFKDKTCFGTQH